jgi:hypothetical protein
MQYHCRICAECKESGGAEIHVTGVSAEDIPRSRQHYILQHDIASEEHIGVVD